MAYTIVKSDGQVLTTIADGQINTTSTSLGLPGRNYAGYGQVLDTNFVHVLENFADSTPPPNPIRGQLWFNTNNNTLCVCPSDGETITSNWLVLTATSSTGTTSFGNVSIGSDLTVGGDMSAAGNLSVSGNIATVGLTASGNVNAGNINCTIANATTVLTSVITTGGNTTAGTITGTWSLVGNSRMEATYADLAERFESETELSPGTVVELGGQKEIRAVRYELSEDVFGVISNTAAYLMNAGAGSDKTHPAVAVSGRVKVKVIGTVAKGDRLVSAGEGTARSAKNGEATAFNTIGRSLEDKATQDLGEVEAIVIIR
jgi:hypothetical protein